MPGCTGHGANMIEQDRTGGGSRVILEGVLDDDTQYYALKGLEARLDEDERGAAIQTRVREPR